MALFAVVAIAGLIASRKGNALAAGASGASSRDVKATDSGRWVVDPFGRHGLRYFDGSSWTTRVMDSGTESVDEPSFEAPAGETERSGWWPDPYGRFGARFLSDGRWTKHVQQTDGTLSDDPASFPPPSPKGT